MADDPQNNARLPIISFDDFLKVDIRLGTIVDVKVFEEAKKAAYQLWIDFGDPLGVKKSSAQVVAELRSRRTARPPRRRRRELRAEADRQVHERSALPRLPRPQRQRRAAEHRPPRAHRRADSTSAPAQAALPTTAAAHVRAQSPISSYRPPYAPRRPRSVHRRVARRRRRGFGRRRRDHCRAIGAGGFRRRVRRHEIGIGRRRRRRHAFRRHRRLRRIGFAAGATAEFGRCAGWLARSPGNRSGTLRTLRSCRCRSRLRSVRSSSVANACSRLLRAIVARIAGDECAQRAALPSIDVPTQRTSSARSGAGSRTNSRRRRRARRRRSDDRGDQHAAAAAALRLARRMRSRARGVGARRGAALRAARLAGAALLLCAAAVRCCARAAWRVAAAPAPCASRTTPGWKNPDGGFGAGGGIGATPALSGHHLAPVRATPRNRLRRASRSDSRLCRCETRRAPARSACRRARPCSCRARTSTSSISGRLRHRARRPQRHRDLGVLHRVAQLLAGGFSSITVSLAWRSFSASARAGSVSSAAWMITTVAIQFSPLFQPTSARNRGAPAKARAGACAQRGAHDAPDAAGVGKSTAQRQAIHPAAAPGSGACARRVLC